MDFTPAQLDAALKSGDPQLLSLAEALLQEQDREFHSWKPRPDKPTQHDEQTAFINCDSPIQILLGGTGSGKSDAAAYKVANFILKQQLPPRKNTPFWLVGGGGLSLPDTAKVLWGEKLSRFIPEEMIAHVAWADKGLGYPKAVRLKPASNGNNWLIEIKAETQGREALQAASIGGFWLSETLREFNIIDELLGRTRDYAWAKAFWDLTPLEPQIELEKREQNPPEGWSFFHLNALLNTALPPGKIERYLAGVPEEIRETRCWGAFASYEGVIFRELHSHHVIEPFDVPADWVKIRGLDFGNNFACVWVVFDPSHEVYFVVHEYYKEGGDMIANHAAQINAVPWRGGSTFGDPADPTSIRELSRHEIYVAGARKQTEASIELMRRLLIANRLFFFNTCSMTVRQHQAYRRKPGTLEPVAHWNHLVDATRYAIFSQSLDLGEFPSRPLDMKPRESLPAVGRVVSIASRNGPALPPIWRDRRLGGWAGQR